MELITFCKAIGRRCALSNQTRKIMRLTTLLLFISALHVGAKGLSQKVTLSKDKITLKAAFRQIEKQTGYAFFWNQQLLDKTPQVNLRIKNASIAEALDQCLKDMPLTYEIVGMMVYISEKKERPPVIFHPIEPVMPPPVFDVNVVVQNTDGQPLEGASIRVKGTQRGVSTDASGHALLKGITSNATLVISFTGYGAQEVTIGSNKTITVRLTVLSKNLDEIVVIGYGTQKKSDMTGAVAGIREKEIQQSKSISLMEAMQGRLAGVAVTSASGEPGSAVNVTIRGTNSFNSGTQPLYVIDGVQLDVNSVEAASSGLGSTSQANPLSGLNPADVVSVEVLKDASATAIFGSRGANGVIIITTKSGKNNMSALEVNTYTGMSFNSKKIRMLGAQDYASYRLLNGTADATYAVDTSGDGVLDKVKDMSGVTSHNWQNEALRKAVTQSYNFSYSGSNAKTNFFVSGTYLNQQGLMINNKYERYSILMKVNQNATERLKLGANVNLSQAIGTGVASNGGNDVRNYDGLLQMLLLTRPVNPPGMDLSADLDGATYSSPVTFAQLSYKKSPLSRVVTDLSANYKIMNGLNFEAHAGAIITASSNGEFYPTSVSWGYGTNGLATLNKSNSTNWYESNTLTWSKKIGKYHTLNAMAGFEVNSYVIETFKWQGQGFDIQNINPLDNISSASVLSYQPATYKEKYNRVSEFTRLNYSFKDRYLFTATLRNDASSKLAENKKSALFPSAGIAWKISKEDFMKNQRFITDMKLRGSFGLTGNERIPPYQSLASVTTTYYSSSSGTATLGAAPTSIANPNLKWETTYAYDAGFDLSLWNDRISFTADAYLKQTKDLLIQADVPAQTGYFKQYQNLGQIDNKGIELSLSTINIKKRSFSWSSNINVSINRNKVVSLGSVSYLPVNLYGGAISSVGRVVIGQPIGTGYGYVFDGIYQVSDFTVKNSSGSVIDPSGVTSDNYLTCTYTLNKDKPSITSRTVKPGDIKYKDLNNDGIVNDADKKIISKSNPKYYGGFSNTFRYKDFELNLLFNWSYGGQTLNLGHYRYEQGASGYANVTQDYWNNRWTPENPGNKYARLNGQGKTDISSYFTENSSYLRLKNVTFTYTIDQAKALKRIGFSGLRLYVTGENLLTFTKYSGFDPEVNSYSPLLPGLDNISYPRPRTIIFGLNIKL